MKIKKFIKNGIHYIRETYDSGSTNTYPDPEFQEPGPTPVKPPLPPLNTVGQKLNFIIDVLHLKDGFS